MRRSLNQMVEEFRLFWRNYVLQSLFATVTVFTVLLVLSLERAVIVASIGASAFIVFAMPRNITAKPRNVIGGHLVGIVCGSLFALVPHSSPLLATAIYSCAVGCSIFVMVITDTEHPPASATALGVAIGGFSWSSASAVLTAAIVLSLVHRYFRPFLRDLV